MTARIYKTGASLKSAVCETSIIILRVPNTALDLRCGGAPMLMAGETAPAGAALDPAHTNQTLVGKRYVDAGETMEFLCTKAGAGSLSVGDEPLAVKAPKALPSSD
jgi:hypothetical protein